MQNGQTSNVATVTLGVGQLTLVVTNTLDDGSTGSFPWAINEANSSTSNLPVIIDFDIPGTGPFVINVGAASLPVVQHSVVINGYSQPGSSPNSLAQGDNAVNLIVLTGGLFDGLDIDGGDSVVDGLVIQNFSAAGIQLQDAGGDLVSGNFIGTDPTGENAQPTFDGIIVSNVGNNTIGGSTPDARNLVSGNNEGLEIIHSGASDNLIAGNYIGIDATGTTNLDNGIGIQIQNDSWGNTIGGSQAGAGNVISGNGGDGVLIDTGSYNIVIQGNLVGTNAAGTAAVINHADGLDVQGNNNTIGGTTAGSGNLLSGNQDSGLALIFMAGSDNLVQGNLIGTDITGAQPIPNQQNGIDIYNNSQFNTIGGTVSGAANTIAFNQSAGVAVGLGSGDYCPGNAILSNSIFGNQHLGIDLGSDGVTLNTPGSPHVGPNLLQSFPVLTQAVAFTGTSTVVVGSLNSDPSTTFTLQFFSNPTADPSDYGQGQTLIGTTTVTTDSSGNVNFQASFPVVVAAGSVVSATATDPSGNTSEFSQDIAVVAAHPPFWRRTIPTRLTRTRRSRSRHPECRRTTSRPTPAPLPRWS